MYALQAEIPCGSVVGYMICNEQDEIIKAWQLPGLNVRAKLNKMTAENPVALYDYGVELAAMWNLKDIPPYLVKTFGRMSTAFIE